MYQDALERKTFELGYQTALTNIVLMGCICHENDRQGSHDVCPVCEAVKLAEDALKSSRKIINGKGE